jgi:AcrR family transcriptional regulator
VQESLFKKLKPGPGLSAERVVANQRARLCGAMVEIAAERGYRGVTVRGLSGLAGVSTRAFYECFGSVEECFGAAQARIVLEVLRRASAASVAGADGIRPSISTAFTALANDQTSARVLLVESNFAGPVAQARARGANLALERFVRDGFAAEPDRVAASSRVVQGVLAAALRVARTRLLAGEPGEVATTADSFATWFLALRDRRLEGLRGPGLQVAADTRDLSPRPNANDDDREIILRAAMKLCVLEGYGRLTVTAIRREAGVSRRSFDAHFSGVSDCFLQAVETLMTNNVAAAESEARRARSWERGVVRIVAALCARLARDPAQTRLAVLEILSPGGEGLERSEGIVTHWAERLRRTAPEGMRPDPLAAEASVAAIWGIARTEIVAGRADRIGDVAAEMAFILLAPAIGAEGADRAIRAELR